MTSALNFEMILWYKGVIATKLDRELLIREIQPYFRKGINIRKDMKVISKNLMTNWICENKGEKLEYY